jgi:hypothetical protein
MSRIKGMVSLVNFSKMMSLVKAQACLENHTIPFAMTQEIKVGLNLLN